MIPPFEVLQLSFMEIIPIPMRNNAIIEQVPFFAIIPVDFEIALIFPVTNEVVELIRSSMEDRDNGQSPCLGQDGSSGALQNPKLLQSLDSRVDQSKKWLILLQKYI